MKKNFNVYIFINLTKPVTFERDLCYAKTVIGAHSYFFNIINYPFKASFFNEHFQFHITYSLFHVINEV